tara:strand:+ start:972 stop:1205 length:234 start_codon:yes stop_codon:yes gene_type:complete
MKVDVSSSSPILRMEVNTNDFGRLFAFMAADEQVEVLRSMVDHMKPHALQWDYVAIELEEPENLSLRASLNDIFSIT